MTKEYLVSRRAFLQTILNATIALPVLAACGRYVANSSSPSSTPTVESLKGKDSNVLFVVIDDLNDWAGPFGGYYGQVHTPNMDRLAARGVTFDKAYCTVPWCNPSRAATMTGLSPATTQFYGKEADMTENATLGSAQTLLQYFKSKGYAVYGAGKVLHGDYPYPPVPGNTWSPHGQEIQPWDKSNPMAPEPRPASGPNNGLAITWSQFDWGAAVDPSETAMPDYINAQWAANLLTQNSSTPFFLALGIYRPHMPWYVPKKYYDLYPLADIQLPDHLINTDVDDIPPTGPALGPGAVDQNAIDAADGATHLHWRQGVQAYLASMSFADACLGLSLDALERGPNANNTTVVLWSDNGFQLGEKRSWRKFRLWEKSARVPLIIAPPGRVSADRKCPRPVSLLDLFPTLADLCAEDVPNVLEGNSLVPLLVDPNVEWPYGALTTYSQSYDGQSLHRSVRTEAYRYILYYDGSEELYDHRGDPQELVNLLSARNSSLDESRRIANALRGLLPATS